MLVTPGSERVNGVVVRQDSTVLYMYISCARVFTSQ